MAYKTKELSLKNSEGNEVTVLISTFPSRLGIQIQAQLASLFTSSGIAMMSLFGGVSSSTDSQDMKEKVDQLATLDKATNTEATSDKDDEKSDLLSRSLDFSKVDIEAAARLLLSNLDKKRVCEMIVELCSFCVIDGKQLSKNAVIFDEVFSGEYGLLFEVVTEVLKTNFGSFFANGNIGKILLALKRKIPMLQK